LLIFLGELPAAAGRLRCPSIKGTGPTTVRSEPRADRPFVERLAAGLYRERYRIDMALSHAPYPQLILDTAALDVARLFRITYHLPQLGHPSIQYRWLTHDQ
jgi:hypothetical protein